MDNTAQKNYQNRDERKFRFELRSTPEKFYLETMDGGFLYPNEFVSYIEFREFDSFFAFKRHGERCVIYTIIFSKTDVCHFSVTKQIGNIYDLWATIERNAANADFFDLETFTTNAEKRIRNFFGTFTISFNI
jgi:hypothetical protein